LLAEPLHRSGQHDRILSEKDTRILATEWLRANVVAGSKVTFAGTVFWTWGEPWLPPKLELVRTEITPESLREKGIRYIVAHDHPLFSSRVDPAAIERLGPVLKP